MKWSLVVRCLSFFFCVYTSTQTEVTCTVPTIENAKTLKKPGTNIEYQCLHGYEPDRFTITCNEQGDWDNMRHCTAKTLDCGPPPSIEHALQVFKEQYKEGETATYVCPSNYVKDGDPYMICSRGRWIGKGKCLLSPSSCLKPEEIRRGSFKDPQKINDYYTEGDTVEYECSEGFMFERENSARCIGRRWTYPTCILKPAKKEHDQPGTTPPKTASEGCDRPPQVEHAVQDSKDRYEDGEMAAYDCPAYYLKEGDLTCTRGRWTGSGKCWKPCTVDLKAMEDRNLQLKHKDTEKIYSTHRDYIGFSCKRGYRLAEGSVPLRQRCNNGEILLPVCE